MVYVLATIGVLVIAVAAFVWWLRASVERRAHQRDEKLAVQLDLLASKLANKEPVLADEVAPLAKKPYLRLLLHALVKHFERLDLFPEEYLDVKSQGEALLTYWMMHPNEFGEAPEEIELVESIIRLLPVMGENGEFLVFRFRMAPGHWAAKDGWTLGVAGPYRKNDVPYSGFAGAFSRSGDKFGVVEPKDLVDWFLNMAAGKGVEL